MKKALLAGLAVVAFGLIAVPSASASTDVCAKPDRCTAATAEDHVDLAAVRTGRDTRAVFRLTCSQGSHEETIRGRVGKSGRRLIAPTLHNPDCTLIARGRAPGETAVVRVSLTS